ncbi:SH2 domain-containing protein 1A-like [Notolabrus celidotus]|uniref:SH2 domain-containing protein 1A-like n=1 Tax=Notolabrus celidotus TaxID=1203425 RepID=UPI0014901E6A|nr:SH2 domain-containing protein 1A-like [Notolabrus celidotus]
MLPACCTLTHTQTHTSACFRGNMESEGRLVSSIYYGRIGSKATERLLERFGREGSFLLRDSESMQGAFCLCVRKTPFVHTYRLVQSTNGWYLHFEDSRVRQQTFRTLEGLIKTYRRASSEISIVALTEPLDKTQIHNISSGQEIIYMETCSRSSVY